MGVALKLFLALLKKTTNGVVEASVTARVLFSAYQ